MPTTELLLETIFYLVPQVIVLVACGFYFRHHKVVAAYCLFFGALGTALVGILPLFFYFDLNPDFFNRNFRYVRIFQWVSSATFAVGLYLLIKEHVFKMKHFSEIEDIKGIDSDI